MKNDEKKELKLKEGVKKFSKIINTNEPSTINSKITQTEKNRFYSELVEMTSDWIWSIDKNGKFTYSNSKIKDLLGFTPKEVIGKTSVDLMTKEEAEQFTEIFQDFIKSQKSFRMVNNDFLHKAGKIKILETSGEPIFDGNGKFQGFNGVARDITELKKTIDTLKESKEKFQDLYENAPDMYLSVDAKTSKVIQCNRTTAKILGYSKKEIIGMSIFDLYTPESAEYAKLKVFPKFIKTGVIKDEELEVRKKDKSIISVLLNATAVRDNNGKIIYSRSIWRDITEHLKAKEMLKANEEKYISLFENSNDGIFLHDLEGKIIDINKKALKQLGYSKSEILSLNVSNLHYPEELQKSKEAFKTIKRDGHVSFEINFKKKNGDIFQAEVSSNIIIINNQKLVQGLVRDITERKKAEEELKKSEQRYKVLFEENLAGVYRSNLEGEILDCNNAFVKMYGYSTKKEVLKTSIRKLHINDKGRKYFLERLKAKGALFNYESQGKKKDGSLIWITENVHLIDGSILQGTIIDITERKESDKKILQLSRGIEQSPEMVIITDVEGNIEYANPKTCEVTGYTREELIGKNPRIFKSKQTPKKIYEKLWETILQGKTWKGELLNKRKNGELYWESEIIAPIINEFGDIINLIGIKEDITEKKKMREDLIKAKEKAEEMSELKSNFLANMSHELRTPMVGILGFTEILEENIEDEEMREYASLLHDSGSRLLQTLNLILNLSKIDANKLVIEKTSVDIISVIKRVATLFKSAADKKNLFLNFENEKDKLVTETDERMIEQILNNLIGNAVKFTNEGGITIKANRIKNNQHIEIIVKDTGIGIHKDKQELIWEEFRQASEGAARLFEGTGLGLTITNNFVKKLGGKILLKSDIEQGSTFIVKLPIQGKAESTDTVRPLKLNIKNELGKTEQFKNSPSILLVDDDKITYDIAFRFLRDQYNLDNAINGSEGIEKATGKKYDIILMDINLKSELDGVEVTKRIRKLEEYKKTPIIAITAYSLLWDRKKYLENGFTDYISKPFTKNDLIDILKKYIPKK